MTFFRIRYEHAGGHVHARVFVGRVKRTTFALAGTLVLREDEFAEVKAALEPADGVEFIDDLEEETKL